MSSWFALVAGTGFALILTKLGTPVVLDHTVAVPQGLVEVIRQSWPPLWGYAVLVLVAVMAGVAGIRWAGMQPAWAFWAPAVWLAWQFAAAIQSVDPQLTVRTLRHFAAVVLCFYLGWLVLGRLRQARGFWLGLLVGFVISVGAGVLQKYGGLEATREFVEQHEQTHWVDFPAEDRERMVNQGLLFPTAAGHAAHPEFLKRLQKGRVFGTFAGYPNALAGAILLLFPAMLVVIWREFSAGKEHLRTIALALVIYLAVGCLIWSGSKSGWLIALGMGVLALLRLPLERKLKIGIVAGVLVVGGVGFAIKYADYFRRGATSVGARVDCWQVAMQVAKGKPLLGTGPGTFGRLYSALKRPDAEMAHLAHNDYLEQASDSGWIGFLAYLAFLPGGLLWLWRGTAPERDWLRFAVWLGLVGWAVQGVAEFGLYIPSLAWIGFLLLGWLWGSRPDGEPEARPARR